MNTANTTVEKFTPGPWKSEIDALDLDLQVVNQTGNVICVIDGDDEANAKLIAVAPDLYEALKDAEKELQEAGRFMDGNDSDIISHWGKGLLKQAASIRELLIKSTE